MSHITGIDLGTTNSACSILNEIGKPEVVPNHPDGDRLTSSAILFRDNNVVDVGADAKAAARSLLESEAGNYVINIKRSMADPDYNKEIMGVPYTPSELSSLILKKVVSGVSAHRGGLGPVAISVPAYFKEFERKATVKAGELAGLDVVSLINEPTAAALAYSTNRKLDGNYLVFDMGGGTFDVTILFGKGKDIEVLTTEGQSRLGGADFDKVIFDIFKEQYMSQTGEDLCLDGNRETLALHNEYMDAAQEVKHRLSKKTKYTFPLINKAGGKEIACEVYREQLVEGISPYLNKAEMLMEKAINNANLKYDDFADVILVGGSTRIPAVANIIRQSLYREPCTNINPDEAVALGAAMHAGYATLKQRPAISLPSPVKEEIESRQVTDVINHSYGTIARNAETDEMINVIMLYKDEKLPASHIITLYTRWDDQERLSCSVTQGDDNDLAFLLPPIYKEILKLPKGRPAEQPIHVKFTCDENHILHCYFRDIGSGQFLETHLDLTQSQEKQLGENKKIDDLQID